MITLNGIEQYLGRGDWRISENANYTYSQSGLEAYLAGNGLRNWALKHSPAGREHLEGDLHIHDLIKPCSPYCSGHSLETLLAKGIRVKLGANSKPAKHFSAACNHVNVYFSLLAQEFAGAQAFSDVDVLLAPFIYYDQLDYESVKQSLQELVFNLNYPARIAFQSVFSNLTFDGYVPEYLAGEHVVWNGRPQMETYGEFDQEVEMFNEAFIDVFSAGDATSRPFTFPIPTLNISRKTLRQPVFDKWLKLTAKYGYPYFDNYIGTGRDLGTTRSMCCRLLINLDDLPARGIWLPSGNTGSVGVVTINMPRIGYLSRDDGEVFEKLDSILEKSRAQLVWKRDLVERSLEKGLLPCTNFYIGKLDSFFQTIGWVGLNEFSLNYFGSPLEDNVNFIIKLMKHIRARLREFKEETKLLWNFEATPAEGASHSLARADKSRYPDMSAQGEEDSIFYTNSTHTAVNSLLSVPQVVRIQEQLQPLYTGGTVWHWWLGEAIPHGEGLARLITKLCDTKLPYFTITPTYSVCVSCRKLMRGEVNKCADCGGKAEVYSRIVGYYRPVSNWHRGKQREFRLRKTFDKELSQPLPPSRTELGSREPAQELTRRHRGNAKCAYL